MSENTMRSLSLRLKFLIGTIGLVILLGLAVIIFIQTTLTQKLKDELQKRGVFITENLARESINPILIEKMVDLQMAVNDHKSSVEDIEYIFVLDSQGEVLVHTFEKGFPVDLKDANIVSSGKKYSVQCLDTEKGDILDIAIPILKGRLGIVHVGLSEEHIKQDVANTIRLILWIVIAVLVLGGGVAAIFATVLTKPLSEITEVAKAVGAGDLDNRVQVRTKDEIGQLGVAFNKMITERKQAEESLKESEEKFKNLSEYSPNMIFINRKGRVVYVNKKCEEVMGYKREEFYSPDFDFLTLIVPEYWDLIQENFSRHIKGKEVTQYEYALITKEGKRIEAMMASKLISFEGENSIIGIVSDVTEHKRAMQLLQYRADFENLITTISTNFINLAPEETDQGINYALQEIGEFAGVDRSYTFLLTENKSKMDNTHEWCAEGIEPQIDNLKGLPVDIFPWWMEKLNRFKNIHIPRVADLPPEANAEKEILQEQDIQSLVVVPMVYGDSLIGFLGFDSVREEKTWPEEIIGLLKIVGEIFANALERKQAEEVTRKAQDLQTVLYQIADATSVIQDLDVFFQFVHKCLTSVIDTTNFYIAFYDAENDKVSFPYFMDEMDTLPAESMPIGRGLTAYLLRGGKSLCLTKSEMKELIQRGEIEIIGTLSEMWLGVPLKVENQNVGAVVVQSYTDPGIYSEEDLEILEFVSGQIADAIVHKQAEESVLRSEEKHRILSEQLTEANNMKELLLDVITHDLKNPAGVISGIMDLMTSEFPNNEMVELVKDSSKSLLRVMENVTTLSKITLGEEVETQELDLGEVIKDVVREFLPTLENNEMSLENNLTELLPVRANPIIAEVFKNYISNAIKYSAEGERILVEVEKDDNFIVISVRDFGKSIPEQDRERVFERGAQLGTNSKGRGLGLAIVKRIAEAHSGKVWVEANEPNGNIFYLKIPRC